MLALGTKPYQIVLLVLLETLFITSLGASIGLISGWSLSAYYVNHPIPLPETSEVAMSNYGYGRKCSQFFHISS